MFSLVDDASGKFKIIGDNICVAKALTPGTYNVTVEATDAPISQKHIEFAPMASTSLGETHATVVLSQSSFTEVNFSGGFQTVQQLRQNDPPNAWECAWVFFDYTDNVHSYYVAFKPNGWELGKLHPDYPGAQRFLASGSFPTFAVGAQGNFHISRRNVGGNAVIKVWANGQLLSTFTDSGGPNGDTPFLSGKLGLYCEDALVRFDNISGNVVDNFESYSIQTITSEGVPIGTEGKWSIAYHGFGYIKIATTGSGWADQKTFPIVVT